MPPSRFGFHVPRRSGFTMKDLLAVIVGLCVLLALLFPYIAGCIRDATILPLLHQGSALSKELLAKKLAGIPEEQVYPMTTKSDGGGKQYASSTDYFHHLIQDEILSCDYSFFGGIGALPVKTIEAKRFTSANNAWSVVVDAPTTKNEQAPLFISRNLVLPDNQLPVGDDVNLQSLIENSADQKLVFSKDRLVVVTISGSGSEVHKSKHLGPGKAHLLNPTAHRLPVLRP